MLQKITPLILTYNESPNINRTLEKLSWANRIVVIDSYSTDDTPDILQSYPQVEVLQRKFDTHTKQWNYGLEQIATEWVLSLDADYVLTDALVEEIKCIPNDSATDGYFIPFKFCIFGNPLRGSILPPRQALFRKEKAIYLDDGHTQLLFVKGNSGYLKNYILHDDRKPLKRWLWAQDRYMIIEAKKLTETPFQELSLGDKIRKQGVIAPFIVFFYCLILKGGILDGWIGWYYAFQRMLAEVILSLKLMEVKNNS
jgi:glycosyltransferase involved in cell wall biosynthesis